MSYGVVCRHGSDLAVLWLWVLAWEPAYAASVALIRGRINKLSHKENRLMVGRDGDRGGEGSAGGGGEGGQKVQTSIYKTSKS